MMMYSYLQHCSICWFGGVLTIPMLFILAGDALFDENIPLTFQEETTANSDAAADLGGCVINPSHNTTQDHATLQHSSNMEIIGIR